jgi:anoctamin-1
LKPQEWIKTRRESLKPWNEFISFGKFKKPTGVGHVSSRLVKNIAYFQTNYLFVFVFLAIYCV